MKQISSGNHLSLNTGQVTQKQTNKKKMSRGKRLVGLAIFGQNQTWPIPLTLNLAPSPSHALPYYCHKVTATGGCLGPCFNGKSVTRHPTAPGSPIKHRNYHMASMRTSITEKIKQKTTLSRSISPRSSRQFMEVLWLRRAAQTPTLTGKHSESFRS